MKVRYAIPLVLGVAIGLYGVLWSVGVSGPGTGPACALISFLGLGVARKWWLSRQRPPGPGDIDQAT